MNIDRYDIKSSSLIARAGGGGSFSGGGGYSGGYSSYSSSDDSSSSGEASAGAMLIGVALPIIVLVTIAAKKKSKPMALGIGGVLSFLIGLLVIPIDGVAVGAIGMFSCGIVVLISAFVNIERIIYNDVSSGIGSIISFKKGADQAREVTTRAKQTDPIWDEASLIKYATDTFNRFQYDWSRLDGNSIQKYTTPEYAKHMGLILLALQQMKRTNIMSDLQIHEMVVSRAYDDVDNSKDFMSVAISASSSDRLVDTNSNLTLYEDKSSFSEQWNFVRKDNMWLLAGIDQSSAEPSTFSANMYKFAADNEMFYSLDWGRLLIPSRGQLFSGGFAVGDINNHIIGVWQGKLLVQLYTYSTGFENVSYTVGQINLPKSYGGIIVERKNRLIPRRFTTPRGYQKVEMEWVDFNERYNVYATDLDQVTSFELLNPSFMAWLYDKNIEVDIEVVDNVVYLYTQINDLQYQNAAGEIIYNTMMEILRRAHKELKR